MAGHMSAVVVSGGERQVGRRSAPSAFFTTSVIVDSTNHRTQLLISCNRLVVQLTTTGLKISLISNQAESANE